MLIKKVEFVCGELRPSQFGGGGVYHIILFLSFLRTHAPSVVSSKCGEAIESTNEVKENHAFVCCCAACCLACLAECG